MVEHERDVEALERFLKDHDVLCKRCHASLRGMKGRSCPECGTTYMLAGGSVGSERANPDVSQGLCPRCGYDRAGLKSAQCPECGYDPRILLEAEPPPLEKPVPPLIATDVAWWERMVKSAGEWLVVLGHALGVFAVVVGFLCGLMLLLLGFGVTIKSVERSVLLAPAAAGAAALAGLIVSPVVRRGARQRRGGGGKGTAIIHVALAWLWLVVGLLVWRLA